MSGASSRAVQLFGVVSLQSAGLPALGAGCSVLTFRDLGAIIADTMYMPTLPDDSHVDVYRRVVEGTFAHATILPAPFGTVFRTRDALLRWFELHYFTLLDAMTLVDDRAMARVTIKLKSEPTAQDVSSTVEVAALETLATESLRLLRAHAVAGLTLTRDGAPVTRASFLVERGRWTAFRDAVTQEQQRARHLAIVCSGPWPPYDFVRMQFGA